MAGCRQLSQSPDGYLVRRGNIEEEQVRRLSLERQMSFLDGHMSTLRGRYEA